MPFGRALAHKKRNRRATASCLGDDG